MNIPQECLRDDGTTIDMVCLYKHRLEAGDVLTEDQVDKVEDLWTIRKGDTKAWLAKFPGSGGWLAVPPGGGLRKAVNALF